MKRGGPKYIVARRHRRWEPSVNSMPRSRMRNGLQCLRAQNDGQR